MTVQTERKISKSNRIANRTAVLQFES